MSLNTIKLPAQLIASLYTDTLVETILERSTIIEETSLPEAPIAETTVSEAEIMITDVKPKIEQPLKNAQKQFDFKGNNKKQILILTATDKAHYLPDHELKFLVSVLKACGLTTEDVAIMNLKHQPSDYNQLQSFFNNRLALLFGAEPGIIDLPMNFPQFQLQNFNKCTYLHAPTLSDIEKAKEFKMKLWTCLKSLFSL